ncbi:unnamed protein product [Rotaria socialis]|uniref:Uncharacterized protein n=1 Tax=Rotaria socialis TaxID=392032 RepID=A0A818XDS7_9BILA|nr:unnamed protein product [Rotaria socialis]CAF4893862.1 unnamed protein product [Rotaria socialis]
MSLMSTSHNHGTRFAVRQASQQNLFDLPQQSPSTSFETSSVIVSSPSKSKTVMNTTVSSRQPKICANNLSKKKFISNKFKSTVITSISIDEPLQLSLVTTDHASSPGTNTATSMSATSTPTSLTSFRNNPVVQVLSMTDDVGLKDVSNSATRASSINVNQLVLDFQIKLKAKDEVIKDLKKKLIDRNQKIADIEQSTMTIPTAPLVIDRIDHRHELIHKEEIQSEIDYKHYATQLNMNEERLKNCIHENDRIKTARTIIRNFPDYEGLIAMDNGWQALDKEKVNVALELIRNVFGPSISVTNNTIRISLATMIRTACWKARN